MLFSCLYRFSYPPNARRFRMRALEEPTVPADNVVHAVLRHLVECYVSMLAPNKHILKSCANLPKQIQSDCLAVLDL